MISSLQMDGFPTKHMISLLWVKEPMIEPGQVAQLVLFRSCNMSYLNRILEAIAMGHSLLFPCTCTIELPMFEDVQDMLSNIETNFRKASPM